MHDHSPEDEADDEDDRPRRRRRSEDEDDDDDDRPRRRRRRRDEDAGDGGLEFVIPVNTNVLAIIAGYVGLVSVLCLPAPIALILGIIAVVQLKKNPKQHGIARAIFAIVMGLLGSIGLVFVLIAAASGAFN